MKIFKNWKELNEPRFTSIGALGLMGWSTMILGEGLYSFLGMLLMDFAVINYFWREFHKNQPPKINP